MATLVDRIVLLTTAIQAKFNAVTPRLLPSGGTTGQVLTKNGTADFAATWTTPAAGGSNTPATHPGYIVGNWYSPVLDTVQRDSQPFANNLYARPIYIASATKLDGLALSTGYSPSISFTSAPAYLAIYNSANGLPTTRIAYGQVSMSSSSTACSVNLSVTTLAPGWYWLAYVSNTRTLVVSNPTASFANNHLLGASAPPSSTGVNGIAATFSYAVPPVSFPSNPYQVADAPVLSWRASA